MFRRFALIVLAAFSCAVCAHSQSNQNSAEPWNAEWITASDAPQKDQVVLHFRKIIELDQIPQHFLVNVSADNQFLFYVNRKRVGSGPSRSDLAHWRYETYDIAPFLRTGKNVIAATVWNFGADSALAQMSDRTGFMVHGQSAAERAADTDASWEVEREKGIATFRPQVKGYYAAEPGERMDGSIFDWEWNSGVGETSSWKKAITLSSASRRLESDSHNNWQLVPDPLPAMEMKEVPAGHIVRSVGVPNLSDLADARLSIPAHTKASFLIDNSELTTAYPELSVTGGRGARIKFTYAEALVDDKGEKGNRSQIEGKHIEGVTDEFFPGGQNCAFMPLTWRTWRFLQIDIETADDPLKLNGLHNFFTAYPFEEKASFHAEDKSLAKIWEVSWRTARLDAHDTYMDTPYWERLQYIGDTRIQALISYTVAGDDRLARQAIDAYNNSRIPDGLTQSRYPSSLVQIIPTFSLMWIGMVHDFWLYRGDEDFVKARMPGVRAVLGWYLSRLRPDGMLTKLPWWPFVDWGQDFQGGTPPQDEDGGSSVITLQLIEALRYEAELEEALGEKYLSEKYRDAAARSAQAVYAKCWNNSNGLLADTPSQRHYSQHANILGIWLDVIPASDRKRVLAKILSASSDVPAAQQQVPSMTLATYYFRFYLARAVEHAGEGDVYLQLLAPWQKMLSLGLTTWAESPEPTRSDSHAWSAHPNYDLLTIVAGIHPGAPGFRTVRIQPHLGKLQNVSASMPTPQGIVRTEYRRTNHGSDATLELPPGTSGELVWQGKRTPLHEGTQRLTLPPSPQ
jgi:alpha-L-rhamnosidase